jgi:hypothetical protein
MNMGFYLIMHPHIFVCIVSLTGRHDMHSLELHNQVVDCVRRATVFVDVVENELCYRKTNGKCVPI